MTYLRYLTLVFFALGSVLCAQSPTKSVLKNVSDNTIAESLTIGSGKTLTIASGATINAAAGSTITGFTAAATWGSITGTLSSQTDLASALNLRAPLESPTFSGTVTIPSGASISGYLTTATAASTYLTSATAASTYLTSATAASTYLTTSTAASTYLTISNAASTYLTPTGNGSGLTSLNASSLSSGTVNDARLSANVSLLGSSIALGSEVTGTLPIANGGTGQTTASAARLALLPSLTGNANKVLTVNSGATEVEWSTPASGGTAISTPKVIYVESNGNDGTGEIGNPAKPFATGTAAYNAGQATSTPFAIAFGTGSFDLYINEPPYLSALQGRGEGLTTVNLYANGQNSSDENAGAGIDLDLKVLHLTLAVQSNGGTASGDSGAGGVGGNVTLRGMAYVSVSSAGGNGPSGGALGGHVILNGPLRVSSVVITGAAGDGTFTADGCDLREVFYAGIYATIGRCSYTASNFTVGNDKGGNASY